MKDSVEMTRNYVREDATNFQRVSVNGLLHATVRYKGKKHEVSEVLAVKNEKGLFVYAVLDDNSSKLDNRCAPNLKAMVDASKLVVLNRGEDCVTYCTVDDNINSIGSSDAVVLFFDDKSRCFVQEIEEYYSVTGETSFDFNARFSIVQ